MLSRFDTGITLKIQYGTMSTTSQAQLLARMLGTAFDLGELYEVRLQFKDGRTYEWISSHHSLARDTRCSV